MLQGGDELGRTQAGNNNAYCQDNILTWFDWQHADNELIDFTAGLIDLRRRFPQLRRIDWLTGNLNAHGQRDIAWWHPDGREMNVNDWNSGQPGALGFILSAPENMANSQTLLVLINRDPHGLNFMLPAGAWQQLCDTSANEPFALLQRQDTQPLPARSVQILSQD